MSDYSGRLIREGLFQVAEAIRYVADKVPAEKRDPRLKVNTQSMSKFAADLRAEVEASDKSGSDK